MISLPMDILSRACHIFLRLAYPGGVETIPIKKRIYWKLPLEKPSADFLPPAATAEGVGQIIPAEGGGIRGYALRLGSAHFPHLKLKLQIVDFDHQSTWIVMVDTHDSFARDQYHPPVNHPDAQEWITLQRANRQMKEAIEAAWEKDGLGTFAGLLRRDLKNPPANLDQ
jgi:hypothetical protein